MSDQQKELIRINNVEYEAGDLPQQVLDLLRVYRGWSEDLIEARLEVAKNEAALRDLASEISRAVAEYENSKDKVDTEDLKD